MFLYKEENMNLRINKVNEDDVNNIAFIKAMLIKKSIEDLDISYKDKIKLKNEILEYLKNNKFRFPFNL